MDAGKRVCASSVPSFLLKKKKILIPDDEDGGSTASWSPAEFSARLFSEVSVSLHCANAFGLMCSLSEASCVFAKSRRGRPPLACSARWPLRGQGRLSSSLGLVAPVFDVSQLQICCAVRYPRIHCVRVLLQCTFINYRLQKKKKKKKKKKKNKNTSKGASQDTDGLWIYLFF